jgi:hypothetical protein
MIHDLCVQNYSVKKPKIPPRYMKFAEMEAKAKNPTGEMDYPTFVKLVGGHDTDDTKKVRE